MLLYLLQILLKLIGRNHDLSNRFAITDNRFVITVVPQKDIYPHGKTYPIKTEAIIPTTYVGGNK